MATQSTLEVAEPRQIEYQAPTPMAMIQRAVELNTDIDKLTKLMDLQERWEKNEARKAFVAAMTEFKKNPPTIIKNKHVSFKETEYDHATLDHVCEQITQGLGAVGISHRWDVDQKDGRIKVTCILTHSMGHSETTALDGPPDATGSKNALQAIGSTVSYLERYTLFAATGLAAKNQDNDGAGSPKYDQLKERLEWIENSRSREELTRIFKTAYAEAYDAKDSAAQKQLVAAKDQKWKELR
jgi:hypothetical protein